MPLETLFRAASYAVIPFWLLLIAAPRWRWTYRLVHAPLVLLVLAPLYAALLFAYGPAPEDMNFMSLFGVMVGFSAPNIVLAGWIHYLIFDLFVGAWESRDAQRRGIHHGWVVPCLIGTLVLGPLGLLGYVLVRFFATRTLEYEETEDL